MAGGTWFDDLPTDFDESVRIDRDERDHREQSIRSYHLTADSRRFVGSFVDRLLGEADDMRSGSSYWLYGYYGSGKSHLLTVLEGLLDTDWLDGRRDDVWTELTSDADADELGGLRDNWQTVHDEYHVIPVSVNLLKYQGQKQRSFSEIVLKHAHQSPDLTGVADDVSEGLSSQLDAAYFEKWFRTTDAWDDRERLAADVLEDVVPSSSEYDWRSDSLWRDVQRYDVLADVVLPELFESVNGTADGYADLQPSNVGPEEVVSRLEELRSRRESELGKPVKLVLLLDEVSLFIGTDFGRLTELQTLAENVNDRDGGDIQLVVTAQADIEDVQPKFAAHGADFSILKDRFPHRYQLPSKHVGEIAKHRLFQKSDAGETAVRETLDEASVKPSESLVYKEIKQNTKPPLDGVDDEELVAYYPFLPYHAPLFLEILFNLRQRASDPAKSIFSGTARAILALMHNLLQSWVEAGKPDRVISLVDLYEQIEPELREILTDDMRVIEGSSGTHGSPESHGIADEVADGDLEPFDLEVAKAVLLLQHVHDIVPLNEGNIAVSVMSDLNGQSWISTKNRVEESLDRLQKFIRPTEDETGARYRFATRVERIIYEETEANEADPDWDDVLGAVDEHLWDEIARELSLPESVPYGESGDEYPVSYAFALDGVAFDTVVESAGGLDVAVEMQGVRPGHEGAKTDEETLYWSIDTDGLADLRTHLVEWWALRDAVTTYEAPPAVERDLERRAGAVVSKLTSVLADGSFTVKDRTDIRGLSTAVETAVDVTYPDDFHPLMLQVTDDRLQELAALSAQDPLPTWAHTIQVPSADSTASQGSQTIQSNVMALTGRQLTDRAQGLNLETVLDGVVAEKPFYDDARPALRAILWGFCREGRLVPVDEDGNTLENAVVLDRERAPTTRLKLLPHDPIGPLLEDGGFKETTETVAEGLISLREANERLRSSLANLRNDVRLVVDTDVDSTAVAGLLDAFVAVLDERVDAADDRLAVVSSQGDGLDEAIEETNEATAWFEEVSDVWNRRLASLHRFDAEIAAGDSDFEWVDEDVQSSVAAQRRALADFEGRWWTTDGWKALVDETPTGLSRELQDAWAAFVEERGLQSFVDRVADHAWVVPASELPTTVQVAVDRTYVAPLREARRWYETIDEALSALSTDDEDALVSASASFADTAPFVDAVDRDVAALESKLATLTEVVGDRDPDEVDLVAVLPDDRQTVDRRLERLVEDGELQVETTESGVIVR